MLSSDKILAIGMDTGQIAFLVGQADLLSYFLLKMHKIQQQSFRRQRQNTYMYKDMQYDWQLKIIYFKVVGVISLPPSVKLEHSKRESSFPPKVGISVVKSLFWRTFYCKKSSILVGNAIRVWYPFA